MIERTAKRLRRGLSALELWPESNDPAHQMPIAYGEHDGETVEVRGKVMFVLRKL